MPLIQYIEKNFSNGSQAIIAQANQIISEYQQQGYDLTLRQLYYQFVARDLIKNKQTEYKRLGAIISDARLAGLIDWSSLVDRTRNLKGNNHWNDPSEILRASASQYQVDKWEEQPVRVEVWIEKDALVGVIARICRKLDVPYFSCRGYNSQSEMWAGSRRLRRWTKNGQRVLVLHLGDHDPSGIDMTRDIVDRMQTFRVRNLEVRRIALNMDQVEEKQPPPNPAKITDSRAEAYISQYGNDSWELDALEPAFLSDLIEQHVTNERDPDLWDQAMAVQNAHRDLLQKLADNWESYLDE